MSLSSPHDLCPASFPPIIPSFTGTSGTIAWELEEQGVHLILMWSVPYNLNIYNSYFGVGVVQLTTRFTRDMLPYW